MTTHETASARIMSALSDAREAERLLDDAPSVVRRNIAEAVANLDNVRMLIAHPTVRKEIA